MHSSMATALGTSGSKSSSKVPRRSTARSTLPMSSRRQFRLAAHPAMGGRAREDAVELLAAAGLVHGVHAVHLEGGERADAGDHLVGDTHRSQALAAAAAVHQLQPLAVEAHDTRSM